MKLTFNGTVISPDDNVFFNDISMWYVRYNDSLVWQKTIKDEAPVNLVASKGQPSNIFVNWNAPSATPLYYNLYRDGGLYKSGISETHFNDTGLQFGERHTYYVTAVYPGPSGDEESDASNTAVGYTRVQAGSQTFTNNGKFTVPEGVTKIKICMIAGGNGGNATGHWWSWYGNGGAAGHLVEKEISVVPGQKFQVRIGKGGAGSSSWRSPGGYGGSTYFGKYKASYNTSRGHQGDGQVTGESGCNKPCQPDGRSYRKKYWYNRWRSGWGGQGTIFGKGGDAGYGGWKWHDPHWHWRPTYWGSFFNGVNAQPGQGYGAGGGSNYTFYYWRWKRTAAAGAPGVCIVSWGDAAAVPSSTGGSTTSNSKETLDEILGYDVLDPNFLNVRRYSTRFQSLAELEAANLELEPNVKLDLSDFDISDFDQVTPETYKGELDGRN